MASVFTNYTRLPFYETFVLIGTSPTCLIAAGCAPVSRRTAYIRENSLISLCFSFVSFWNLIVSISLRVREDWALEICLAASWTRLWWHSHASQHTLRVLSFIVCTSALWQSFLDQKLLVCILFSICRSSEVNPLWVCAVYRAKLILTLAITSLYAFYHDVVRGGQYTVRAIGSLNPVWRTCSTFLALETLKLLTLGALVGNRGDAQEVRSVSKRPVYPHHEYSKWCRANH